MDTQEREKFYDEEVAPVLMELAKKCLENGLSMLASVEWDPTNPDDGGWGKTMALQRVQDRGLPITMQAIAVDAGRNVDSLILGIARHCNRHGIDLSQSMYLSPDRHKEF